MSVKKTYSLSSTQQLIDLNGQTTNFDLSFAVTSKGKQPFDLIVVDQSTLDNNPNLEFKRANEGSMSGNIISDKNVYQNYFLCLKSDTPCEVEVSIDKKEISPNLNVQEPNQYNDLNMPSMPSMPNMPSNSNMLQVANAPVMHHHPVQSGTNWKMILLTLVIVCGGLYLYYLYTTKNKNKKKNVVDVPVTTLQENIIPSSTVPIAPIAPIVPTTPIAPMVPTNSIDLAVPSIPSTSNFGFTKKELDLQNMIARLNSLPTK